MEGTEQARSRIVGQGNDFVVRQFSPTRIERLLLTRLFDLTTGHHIPGEPGGASSGPLSCSQTDASMGQRQGGGMMNDSTSNCSDQRGDETVKHGGLSVRAGIYARVSSDQQAEQQTIKSQISALRERVEADGHSLPEQLCFLDDGVSGATLTHPALEKLRDTAYAGGLHKLYVHSPDRLARKYAWQVLLVDELHSHGVEIVFLNHTMGASPEDDLLLQMQGMFAEYERAKILERSRRGKRHAAQRGSVNVLSGAPYGYRYITKQEGNGTAAYEVIEDQAAVVKQVFEWVGCDRLSIGEVSRRLKEPGVRTATGKTWWDRTTVWGMLQNTAYKGSAAFRLLQQKLDHCRRRAIQNILA